MSEYQFEAVDKPLKLMKKYFDIHLYYYANRGTRTIMFKIPGQRIDIDLVKQYENDEIVRIHKSGVDLIFELTADSKDCEE